MSSESFAVKSRARYLPVVVCECVVLVSEAKYV